jgi:cation transport protein ChaC
VSSDVWIFGYGSLIFRADFPYLERRIGIIRGFARRFWQSSPDHRGTPAAPGRVVTLVESPGSALRGVAYRVAGEQAERVLAELDQRERAGYERLRVAVELEDASVACAFVYQARADNPGYVHGATTEQIARIVRGAVGPSGDNASYVVRLARALREIGEEDPHVFEIERFLTELP